MRLFKRITLYYTKRYGVRRKGTLSTEIVLSLTEMRVEKDTPTVLNVTLHNSYTKDGVENVMYPK